MTPKSGHRFSEKIMLQWLSVGAFLAMMCNPSPFASIGRRTRVRLSSDFGHVRPLSHWSRCANDCRMEPLVLFFMVVVARPSRRA